MQQYLNQLSNNLIYIKHEIIDNKISLFCETKVNINMRVHSRKIRVVQDIPYGNYKVELHIITKKYFSTDKTGKLTTAEKYDFLGYTGRRTKRLEDYLLNMSKEMSAIGVERTIKKNIADVSDTVILRILKKNEIQ